MSTITFSCHKCGQTLRVGADKAGRKAKCTKCAEILTIPAAEEEAATEVEVVSGPPPRERSRDDDDDDRPRSRRDRDDYDDDRPRRRSRRDDDYDDDRDHDKPKKTKWRTVAVGALINKIGAITLFCGMAVVGLGAAISSLIVMINPFSRAAAIGGVILILGVVVAGLAYVAVLVGHVFFLIGLSKKHGWGLALASLITLGAMMVFSLLAIVFGWAAIPAMSMVSNALSTILVGVHMILIGLTFARVGESRDDSLRIRGRTVMTFGGVFLGFGFLMMAVIGALAAGGVGAAGAIIALVLMVIFFGITLGMYFMYMLASFLMRSATSD